MREELPAVPNNEPSEAADSGRASAAKKTTPAGAPAAKKTAAKKATGKKATGKKAGANKAAAAKKAGAKKAAAPSATAHKPAADTAAPAFPPADLAGLDRPWIASYPPLVPESYPYPDVPFSRLLDDAAKDFPDSVAVNFLGKTLTYRRLSEQVDRFATALQTLGVSRGDRVGIALPNCPQHLIAFGAVLRLAAVVVEIDSTVDERALAARINDAGCRVLVVLDPVYAKVERLKGQVPTVEHVVGTAVADYLSPLAAAAFKFRHRRDASLIRKIPAAEGVLRFSELVRRHPPTAAQERVDPATDVALLTYTDTDTDSGPRGVMLTHRNLLVSVFQIRLWVPDVQAGRETILCAVPFSTAYGLTTGLGLGILAAATMALAPSADRDELLGIIDNRKPTIFPATTAIIEDVSAAPHLGRHDLTSVRASLCDTSLLSEDVIATFERATGARLREGLAIPEATSLTHANPVYGKAKPGRVGLPLSDTFCALVDPADHRRVATGTTGELAVHGPQVMKGYWQRPEETAAAVVDGWLFTGLHAEVDDEGYYSILGRV